MGSLYKQKNRDGSEGRIWWAKYYVAGQARRESTGTENKDQARTFLKEREGRVATGRPILPRADRVRYEELAADLRQHYQATGDRGLVESADGRLPHDSIPRMWGGPGAGETCDACDQVVTKPQMLMEGIPEGRDRQGLRMHVQCFWLWDKERRVEGHEPSAPTAPST
jgi:hypothetical protein